MNDEAVYRTAPATPSLLIILKQIKYNFEAESYYAAGKTQEIDVG